MSWEPAQTEGGGGGVKEKGGERSKDNFLGRERSKDNFLSLESSDDDYGDEDWEDVFDAAGNFVFIAP